VCWPLLCFFVAQFCIFGRCLDSNPESCHSKQARYQLRHVVSVVSYYLPYIMQNDVAGSRQRAGRGGRTHLPHGSHLLPPGQCPTANRQVKFDPQREFSPAFRIPMSKSIRILTCVSGKHCQPHLEILKTFFHTAGPARYRDAACTAAELPK
jgi:hypothetical protein